jgi:uncharacterized metal-binding protein
MPSGKVHDTITLVTAAAAVPAWWLFSPDRDAVAFGLMLGAYTFSGLWLSHDLDTRSVAYERWGPLKFLWWPYRKLVPHRSWISHGLGIGPLLRVVYFGIMLWALTIAVCALLAREGIPVNRDALLGGVWRTGVGWTLMHPSYAVWVTAGLVLGGVMHSIADSVVSFAKRVW